MTPTPYNAFLSDMMSQYDGNPNELLKNAFTSPKHDHDTDRPFEPNPNSRGMALWERVKHMEETHNLKDHNDLAECKATLIVNFGKESGRSQYKIVNESDSLLKMMTDVIEYFMPKTPTGKNENL